MRALAFLNQKGKKQSAAVLHCGNTSVITSGTCSCIRKLNCFTVCAAYLST